MKMLPILAVVLAMGFTSCKKCKDCEIKINLDSSYPLSDADCQETFVMDCVKTT